MINYSIQQNLKIPIGMFFNTVKRVRNYKHFVPWCTDSWEMNKIVKHNDYHQLVEKYSIFEKNKSAEMKIKQLLQKNSPLKMQTFDGGLTAGFNIIDFSYTSHVLAIEPNIVVSITDSSKSHIFKRLESLWVLNEADQSTQVEYFINFEFKSQMYSHVTNMFLNFLGDNIMKAFVNKCNTDLSNLNQNYNESEFNRETFSVIDFFAFIDNKLDSISFDSPQDRINLRSLLDKLYELKKINLNEIDKLFKVITYNKNAMKNLAFLAEIAVWNNAIQIEKIRREVQRNFD